MLLRPLLPPVHVQALRSVLENPACVLLPSTLPLCVPVGRSAKAISWPLFSSIPSIFSNFL